MKVRLTEKPDVTFWFSHYFLNEKTAPVHLFCATSNANFGKACATSPENQVKRFFDFGGPYLRKFLVAEFLTCGGRKVSNRCV